MFVVIKLFSASIFGCAAAYPISLGQVVRQPIPYSCDHDMQTVLLLGSTPRSQCFAFTGIYVKNLNLSSHLTCHYYW